MSGYKPLPLAVPDEWRTYVIPRFLKASDIHVRIQGTPPCFHCGKPVIFESMDGPLVCGNCDMGLNAEGKTKTQEQYVAGWKHFGEMMDKYETEESRELRRTNGEKVVDRDG